MQQVDVFEVPLDEQPPAPAQEKEKVNAYERQFIEDTIKIRCADFGKGVLVPQEVPNLNKSLTGKKGTFTTGIMAYDLIVRYTVNLNTKYTELNINYNYDDGSSFCRSQTIRLVRHELPFGEGWSFVCNICNKSCKSLFLPRGNSFFACRSCKKLHYGKCYFKRHIQHHLPLYGLNRYNKIMSNYPRFKRHSYNKRPTKKFLQLYKMYLKEGLKFSEPMMRLMKKYDIAWELRDYVFKNGFCS